MLYIGITFIGIRALTVIGLPFAIRDMVRDQLGEKLSLSHISRLAGRRKVRAA